MRHRKLDAPYRLVRQAFVMSFLAGVLVARRGPAGERSPVVFP